MGHLVFKVLFIVAVSFFLPLPLALSANSGTATSWFTQKTLLINWPSNCMVGLNLRLDNLIALLHLNLFSSALCSVRFQKNSIGRG